METRGMKDAVREHAPRLYELGRQLRLELRVIRQVGFWRILSVMMQKQTQDTEHLPIQQPSRFPLPWAEASSCSDFSELALRREISVSGGTHTVYFPPEQFRASAFGRISSFYPTDAGLKVLRTPGRSNEPCYVFGEGYSRVQLALLHKPDQLLLVANRLFAEGVGGRVYDLLELDAGNKVWTAYVVQHLEEMLSGSDGSACIESLRGIVTRHRLELVTPGGFDHSDFQPPHYSGNIRRASHSQARYVDFQNFKIVNYGEYLSELAKNAAAASHFGDKSFLRGGRYLYQTIPGVSLPAKRAISDRMAVIDRLIEQARITMNGRVVLDFGCNIGMMMAEYLRRGAVWCVGWELAHIASHAEKLLYAVGCTRFTLVPGRIHEELDCQAQVPSFVVSHLSECIISYLAVRGHFGWLPSLTRMPWAYLLYEGHESESPAESHHHFEQLSKMTRIEVVSQECYVDGDSRVRTAALLRRVHPKIKAHVTNAWVGCEAMNK